MQTNRGHKTPFSNYIAFVMYILTESLSNGMDLSCNGGIWIFLYLVMDHQRSLTGKWMTFKFKKKQGTLPRNVAMAKLLAIVDIDRHYEKPQFLQWHP